ncbi:MAG TPA: transcription termination/antitermination NusG family protein, partial [Acidimicrobiales bacterium]
MSFLTPDSPPADVDLDAAPEVVDAPAPDTDAGDPSPEAPAAEVADEVIDAEALLEEEAPEPVQSPYDRPGRWYVVHTQSGYEKKVKQNLEARTSSMNMEGRIHEVVIPMEEVVEFKGGKKVV